MVDWFSQLGNAGTMLVGGIGIYVALRSQRRQVNAQTYLEVSGRFQELLRLFPTEAWLANRNPAHPMPPPSREITDCTLYALQFASDVYYLRRGGYIPEHLWKVWERAIRRTLTGPVFQREWPGLAIEFAHSVEFVNYINTTIHCSEQKLQRDLRGTRAADLI